MSGPRTIRGKVLVVDGKVVTNPDCCCCPTITSTECESWSVFLRLYRGLLGEETFYRHALFTCMDGEATEECELDDCEHSGARFIDVCEECPWSLNYLGGPYPGGESDTVWSDPDGGRCVVELSDMFIEPKPGDWLELPDGADCTASRDLGFRGFYAQRFRYRFGFTPLASGNFRIEWVERYTPEKTGSPTDTPRTFDWDGVTGGAQFTPWYDVAVPDDDGQTGIYDVEASCPA